MSLFLVIIILIIVGIIICEANHDQRKMPLTGAFVGYKKIYIWNEGYYTEVIAKLLIPSHALRNQYRYGRGDYEPKCRASEAIVLSLNEKVSNARVEKATSGRDFDFIYSVGKVVTPQYPFDTSTETCASGIHFYMLKKDAINH